MNYLKTALSMIFQDIQSYKNIGNDSQSFKHFFKATVTIFYILFYLEILLVFLFRRAYLFRVLNGTLESNLIVLLVAFTFPFILALISIASSLLFTLFPYFVGVLFGGKAKTYIDYYKVLNFSSPIIYFVSTIIEYFQPIKLISLIAFTALWILILYKTNLIIHKLSKPKSILTTVITVVASIILVGILIRFFVGRISLFNQV